MKGGTSLTTTNVEHPLGEAQQPICAMLTTHQLDEESEAMNESANQTGRIRGRLSLVGQYSQDSGGEPLLSEIRALGPSTAQCPPHCTGASD